MHQHPGARYLASRTQGKQTDVLLVTLARFRVGERRKEEARTGKFIYLNGDAVSSRRADRLVFFPMPGSPSWDRQATRPIHSSNGERLAPFLELPQALSIF